MLTSPNNLEGLLAEIYGDLEDRYSDPEYLTGRATLAPKNIDVKSINNAVIARIPSEVCFYISHKPQSV